MFLVREIMHCKSGKAGELVKRFKQMGPLMAFFDKSYPKAGATIVLVYLVGMILIWFAPETKDQPLPE